MIEEMITQTTKMVVKFINENSPITVTENDVLLAFSKQVSFMLEDGTDISYQVLVILDISSAYNEYDNLQVAEKICGFGKTYIEALVNLQRKLLV